MTGRVGLDPTAGLTMPKARAGEPDGQVRPEDVPTRGEVLAILGAAPPRFRAATTLGATGLPVGEVLAVTSDRPDLDRRRLLVDRQLQRIGNQVVFTSPKRERSAPWRSPKRSRSNSGDTSATTRAAGSCSGASEVPCGAGTPSTTLPGAPRWSTPLAAGRFVFHSLRHFAASSMLAEGAPITAVAGHLGDTVETVERIYAHWLHDDTEVPAMVLDPVLAVDLEETAARS